MGFFQVFKTEQMVSYCAKQLICKKSLEGTILAASWLLSGLMYQVKFTAC